MRLIDDSNPQVRDELARAGVNVIRPNAWERLFPAGDDRRPIAMLVTVPIARVRSSAIRCRIRRINA